MNAKEFSFKDLFQSAIRHWWVILAGIFIGGLLGLGFATRRAPLYEASASILISVDRNRTMVQDDITIYQADDRVRELIVSDDTLGSALDLLSSVNGAEKFSTPADFRSALKISQRAASFELFFYAENPNLAAEGANAWAQASLAALEQAFRHAVRAAELQGVLYEAHCSLTLVEERSEEHAVWVCTSADSNIDPGDLPTRLLEEIKKSRGILPSYTFSLNQAATVPDDPILWARSTFILAGAVAGSIFGFLSIVLISRRKSSAELH